MTATIGWAYGLPMIGNGAPLYPKVLAPSNAPPRSQDPGFRRLNVNGNFGSVIHSTSTRLVLCLLGMAYLPISFGANQTSVAAKESVRIAWGTSPRTADPRYAADPASQHLVDLVHCALVSFDADGKPIGHLAKTWTWKDRQTLQVNLNAGSTFSNGSPVTATDVKSTYDFFKRQDALPVSPRTGEFIEIQEISIVDSLTVLFKLKKPDGAFASKLSIGILPANLAKAGPQAIERPPVGCGPFAVKSSQANEIVLESNGQYHLSSPPKIKRIEIHILKDERVRLAKLKGGEIDLIQNLIGRDRVTEISRSNPNLRVQRRVGLNTTFVGFNLRDPILKNVAVRKAISLAVNRELVVSHILGGLALPASTLLPPFDRYYDHSLKATVFNPKAAAQILDVAGFKDPDGTGPQPRLTLVYKTTTNDLSLQIGKSIAVMLGDVGIQIIIRAVEPEKFKDEVEKGKVQLWSLTWMDFRDPDFYRFAFASDSFPPNGGNYGGFSNFVLDNLLKEGSLTTDETLRRTIYSRVQQLVQQELPYVFLWHEDVVAITNRSLKNFEIFADGSFNGLKNAFKE